MGKSFNEIGRLLHSEARLVIADTKNNEIYIVSPNESESMHCMHNYESRGANLSKVHWKFRERGSNPCLREGRERGHQENVP